LIDRLTSFKNFISNKPSAQLAVIAGLSGFIYALVFTLPFPLTSLYRTIPPVDYTKLTNYALGSLTAYVTGIGTGGLVGYATGIGILFGLYLWTIRLSAPTDKEQPQSRNSGQRSVVSGHFILTSSAILALISIFSYPLTAIDLFIYAIRTRGWALYGLNPLATAPETLPSTDVWLGLAGEWVDAPSPYGPLWELLSLGTFYLSGGDFMFHLLALKIVAALAYLGCVWLVYKILQHLQPEWATAGAIAFGWSPLVLLESVQNGHNDIVMVFFLLAAVWAFARWAMDRHPSNKLTINPFLLLVCVCLALSILVKFVTAVIVPFFLIGMAMAQPKWRQRLAAITLYGALIVGLVVLAMLPFWPGLNNWAVLQAGSGAGRSFLALLVLVLRGFLGTNTAFEVSRTLIMLIFALVYFYYLWQMITGLHQTASTYRSFSFSFDFAQDKAQNKPPYLPFSLSPRLPISSAPLTRFLILPLYASFFVLFWYVLIAAPVFHAWYLLWFLSLAVLLLPYYRPFIAGAVFSMTALLVIPYFETIRVWHPILLENQLVGHLLGVSWLIGPPIIATLWPIRPSESSEV
jgi:hypothetical protein